MFETMEILDWLARFGVNVIAMTVLVYGLFYSRHRDKGLAGMAAMLNISAFVVLGILSRVDISLAAGFGLLAVLALFSQRSEQLGLRSLGYVFGAVVIAAITAFDGSSIGFVALAAVLVVLGAYMSDHPALFRDAEMVKVTLDQIDTKVLSHPDEMKSRLSRRLGVDVMSYRINCLNYVNDLAVVNVYYRKA